MFKTNKKRHQNHVIDFVLVSLLLTLNIFHFFLVFLLLTINRSMFFGILGWNLVVTHKELHYNFMLFILLFQWAFTNSESTRKHQNNVGNMFQVNSEETSRHATHLVLVSLLLTLNRRQKYQLTLKAFNQNFIKQVLQQTFTCSK